MKTLTTFIVFCFFAGYAIAQSGEGEPVTPSEFIGSFTMEVTGYKKGKVDEKSSMKVDYYFDEYKMALAPTLDKKEKTTMIFDRRDKSMTTLIDKDGEKSGMKMKMPKLKLDQMRGDKDADTEFSYERTGETKTIDGYQCRKYLMEGEDYKGYAWVAEDFAIDFSSLFSFIDFGNKKNNPNAFSLDEVNGFPLESHIEFKDKKESVDTKIKNIQSGQVDAAVFDTSDYNIMDLGGMNFGN